MAKQTASNEISVSVMAVSRGQITYCLRGDMPLIYNQVNEKAKHELLLPAGRKNAAEKQSSLKHDPVAEFRNSVYRHGGNDHPTRFYFPATAFKAALCTAALDMPGTKKAQIGRLVWCEGDRVDVYGIPKLFMAIVRSADMNRTPDVRTRAILPRWACQITVSYAIPLLKEAQITNLLAAAGFTVGIGDYRQEKGKGSYGQYSLVAPDEVEYRDIVENEGREAQDLGLELAEAYDHSSEELLGWYKDEITRRTTAGRVAAKPRLVEETVAA